MQLRMMRSDATSCQHPTETISVNLSGPVGPTLHWCPYTPQKKVEQCCVRPPWDWRRLEGKRACCTNSSFIKNGLACAFILKAYATLWVGLREAGTLTDLLSHSAPGLGLVFSLIKCCWQFHIFIWMYKWSHLKEFKRVLESYFNTLAVSLYVPHACLQSVVRLASRTSSLLKNETALDLLSDSFHFLGCDEP